MQSQARLCETMTGLTFADLAGMDAGLVEQLIVINNVQSAYWSAQRRESEGK
jgi:hypothetical protein